MKRQGYTYDHFKNDLNAVDGEIIVNIKSYGGDVHEALAIYDLIRTIKNNVTTRIVGATASAGTLIAMAGDKREMTANTRYLIHRVMADVSGNVDDMQRVINQLQDYDKQLIKLYVNNSNLDEREVLELMREEKFISADTALELGFVDTIIQEKSKIKKTEKMEKVLNTLNASSESEAVEKLQAIISKQNGVDKIANKLLKMQEEQEEKEKEMSDKEEEIENLKSKIAELEKEIEEEEEKKEAKNTEETEEEVTNAIKEGRIKADAKDDLIEFGKQKGVKALKNLIHSIPTNLHSFKDLVKGHKISSKADALKMWKSNEISTSEYQNYLKTLKQ